MNNIEILNSVLSLMYSMAISEKKANLIRVHKKSCTCCRADVNNNITKYGYERLYFVNGENFLCERCYIKQHFIKKKNIYLLFLFYLNRVPLIFRDYVTKKNYIISYKILEKAKNAVLKILNKLKKVTTKLYNYLKSQKFSASTSNKRWKISIYILKLQFFIEQLENSIWRLPINNFYKYGECLLYEFWRDSLEYTYLL